MELFNLQIRKIGEFTSLYKEIDKILSDNNIIQGGVSRKFTQEGAAHALQKMMREDKWFDVCTIDAISETSKIRLSSERKAAYLVAHCVNWGDMTENYKKTLIAMVMDDFRALFLNPN